MFNAEEIAKKINWPLNEWPSQCFAVACEMVRNSIVDGRAVYGLYSGPVSSQSIFANKVGMVRHGWIESGNSIIDPTRWVFENVEPYIYVGDKDNPEYDKGASRLERAIRTMFPKPDFNPQEKVFEIPNEYVFVFNLLIESDQLRTRFSMSELFWLANIPLSDLGSMAEPLYKGLIAINQKALIKLDSLREVIPEKGNPWSI